MESLFRLPEGIGTYEAAARTQLANSFGYLYGLLDHSSLDQPSSIDVIQRNLEESQQLPAVFARYLDLVAAVQGNDAGKARSLFEEIDELCRHGAEFRIAPFSPGELGSDFEQFPRILFTEDYGHQPIVAASAETYESIRHHLESGLELLSKFAPTVRNEIDVLWTRIYVGENNQDEGGKSFAGVTSFLLWGATFLNANAYRTLEQVVEFLVHESTHSLLFALSCDEPLVRNRIEERYPSPLRSDPRPMDGIYHATLVSARIASVMDCWLKAETGSNSETIQKMRAGSLRAFSDGAETVTSHARLSPLGRELFSQAAEAMNTIS